MLRLLEYLSSFISFLFLQGLVLMNLLKLKFSQQQLFFFIPIEHLLLGLTSLHINRLEFLALFQLGLFFFDSLLLSFLGQLKHETFIILNLVRPILFEGLYLIEKQLSHIVLIAPFLILCFLQLELMNFLVILCYFVPIIVLTSFNNQILCTTAQSGLNSVRIVKRFIHLAHSQTSSSIGHYIKIKD